MTGEKPKEEIKKTNTNSIADKIKNMTGEKPKEEIKKTNTNSIADKIKNMKSCEIPKKEEPKKTSNIADRIKNLNSTEIPKKEEPKKTNNFADRIKNMEGKSATKQENQKPAIPKRGSVFNPNPMAFKQEKKAETTTNTGNQPMSFGNKLNKLNEMFKNKGFGPKPPGGHRPSMILGMPQNFKFGKQMPGSSIESKKTEIIMEEPDKMKPGYDPSANLQKTLDSVVIVKKDKKKKKKPGAFKG